MKLIPNATLTAVLVLSASAQAQVVQMTDKPFANPQASGLPLAPAPGFVPKPAADAPMASGTNVAVAATSPAAASARRWELRAEVGSLNAELARWAQEAGWQYLWDVPEELEFQMNRVYVGTFEQAVDALRRDLAASASPVIPTTYAANRVLRIVRTGDRK